MILKVVQWILFIAGVLSLTIGVVVVHVTSKQEDRQRSHTALVESGEIKPVNAVVTGKRIDERSSSSGIGQNRTSSTTEEYRVFLQIDDSESVVRMVSRSDYEAIQKGEVYDAYLIEGSYFVPRLDAKIYGYVKWIIFSVTCIPMLSAIALFALRVRLAFRARSKETRCRPDIA